MLKIICFILITILILFCVFRFKSTRFWWRQPILFSNLELGNYKTISNEKVPLVPLKSKYVSSSFNFPNLQISKFLYSHFDRESSYSLNYFGKMFRGTHKHYCVHFQNKSKIVGTILSRNIQIQIKNHKIKQFIYVDGMCVHPTHRKQRICSHLMSLTARFFFGRIIFFRKDGDRHGFLPYITTSLYKIPKMKNKFDFELPRKKIHIKEIINRKNTLLQKNYFENSIITYYLPNKGPPTVIRWIGTKTHTHWNFFLHSIKRSSAFMVASRNTCKLKILPMNVQEQKIHFYAWNLRFPKILTWDQVSFYSLLL